MRDTGYYWVKHGINWEIAFWSQGGFWLFIGTDESSDGDGELEEINEVQIVNRAI